MKAEFLGKATGGGQHLLVAKCGILLKIVFFQSADYFHDWWHCICSIFEGELSEEIPVIHTSIAGCRIIGRMCVGEYQNQTLCKIIFCHCFALGKT